MNKRRLFIVYKTLFPLLVLAAVITQFVHVLTKANGSVVNFLSFFTIESNLFGAIIMLLSAYTTYKGRKQGAKLAMLRGAATLYMVVTGIIYGALLAGTDVQTAIPWVNAVVHFIFPAIIFLDWLIDRPACEISVKNSLAWLSYPLAYIAYTLVRGPLANDWYPYPFINVAQHGYAQVAINSVAIGVIVFLLAILIAKMPGFISKSSSRN